MTKSAILAALTGGLTAAGSLELPSTGDLPLWARIGVALAGAVVAPVALRLGRVGLVAAAGILRGTARATRRLGARALGVTRESDSEADDLPGELAADFLSEGARALEKGADILEESTPKESKK